MTAKPKSTCVGSVSENAKYGTAKIIVRKTATKGAMPHVDRVITVRASSILEAKKTAKKILAALGLTVKKWVRIMLILAPLAFLTGCGTPNGGSITDRYDIGGIINAIDFRAIEKAMKKDAEDKPADGPAIPADDLNVSQVQKWKCKDASGFQVTHDLAVSYGGEKSVWKTAAVNEWTPIKGDGWAIVGTCCLIKWDRRYSWIAFYFDHIRPGQSRRGFPMNPPHPKKGHGDYMTVTKEDIEGKGVYAFMYYYNGGMRTRIIKLKP